MSPWLAAAYACLAIGLAWSLTGGVRWVRRVPFIVAAPAIAFGLWLDRPDAAGWPSSGAPPAHATLVSAVVHEPDATTADRGRIYLWLDVGSSAPRAFAIPYTRSAHEQVQRALASLARRQTVELTRSRGRSGGRTRGGAGASRGGLRFTVRRLPQLPAKSSTGAPAPAGR